MIAFRFWPSSHKDIVNEREVLLTQRMEAEKGRLHEAVANYRVKMDWATKLANQTLDKLDRPE